VLHRPVGDGRVINPTPLRMASKPELFSPVPNQTASPMEGIEPIPADDEPSQATQSPKHVSPSPSSVNLPCFPEPMEADLPDVTIEPPVPPAVVTDVSPSGLAATADSAPRITPLPETIQQVAAGTSTTPLPGLTPSPAQPPGATPSPLVAIAPSPLEESLTPAQVEGIKTLKVRLALSLTDLAGA
jgi:hypothetical protein